MGNSIHMKFAQSVRIFAKTFMKHYRNRRETRRHNWRKFARSGWDSVVYGYFHKPLKTLFDWPETLTSVWRTTQTRLWLAIQAETTVRTTNNRKASPLESLRLFLFLLEFINLLRRKTGLWFEAIQFVGRRTILSTMLAWFSRKSAHFFGPGQAQVHRECVETSWALWLPSVSRMFEF